MCCRRSGFRRNGRRRAVGGLSDGCWVGGCAGGVVPAGGGRLGGGLGGALHLAAIRPDGSREFNPILGLRRPAFLTAFSPGCFGVAKVSPGNRDDAAFSPKLVRRLADYGPRVDTTALSP